MSTRYRGIGRLSAAALLLVAICGLAGCNGCEDRAAAPLFQLDTLAHGRFYLADQFGRVTVLVFWTTSCTPCKEELVQLERMRTEAHHTDWQLIAICADPENHAELQQIVRALELRGPILLDRGGRVVLRYGVSSFPTTVVIDQAGRIRYQRSGWSLGDEQGMRLLLERLRSSHP